MIVNYLFSASLVLYAISALLYSLMFYKSPEKIEKYSFLSLLAGIGAHSVSLVFRTAKSGHVPVTNMFESLSFFSWTCVLIFLIFRARYGVKILGAFVAPFVLALMLYASTMPMKIVPIEPVLRSPWLPLHAVSAFFGNGFLAMAFLAGVMYLIQEDRIKKKKVPGKIFLMLPSLDMLDKLGYDALKLGFPLLTLTIITGAMWSQQVWGKYWHWEPKQTWSLITWLVYAALLHQRLNAGWRGRKAAIMIVIGFVAVIFTFIGVNVLLFGKHIFV